MIWLLLTSLLSSRLRLSLLQPHELSKFIPQSPLHLFFFLFGKFFSQNFAWITTSHLSTSQLKCLFREASLATLQNMTPYLLRSAQLLSFTGSYFVFCVLTAHIMFLNDLVCFLPLECVKKKGLVTAYL